MTISVPKAGNNPGRAPEIRERMPRTGQMIADLGRQGFEVAARLQEERDNREFQRAKIDMTRDLNNLRLEAMQIGDPEELEAFWTSRTADLRSSYLEGTTEDGSPRVNERIREDFALAYDSLSSSMSYDVGRTAISARNSQRRANWLAYEQEITTGAESAGPETRATMVAQGEAEIDKLVASGAITPEEGQRRKISLAGNVDNAAAIQGVAIDPAGFLTALDEGQYSNLDPEAQARYRVQAESALARMEAAEEKAAEAEADAREKAIGEQLSEITDIYRVGREPKTAALLDDPAYQEHEDYARARAAQSLFRQEPMISRMSAEELDALIAEEKKRPLAFKWQNERLALLKEWREANHKDFATDPMSAARDREYPVPDLPDFDPSSPVDYMRGVRQRAAISGQLQKDGHIKGIRIFDEDEAATLRASYGPQGDPAERTAWISAMTAALEDDAPAVIRQVTQDPTTAYAATLIRRGGDRNVVASMLAGQRRVADKTVVLPSHDEFITAYDEATEAEFSSQFDLTPQLIDAATYLYAEAGGDPEDIDGKLFGQSVQRALGARPDENGNYTIGGLQELDTPGTFGFGSDNYRVDLPVGVRRDDVQTALETLNGQFEAGARPQFTRDGRQPGEARELPGIKTLEAVSLTGSAPNLGAPEDAADNFANLRMASIWRDGRPTGTYAFYRLDGQGNRVVLRDTAGALFKFRVEDLIEEAGQ